MGAWSAESAGRAGGAALLLVVAAAALLGAAHAPHAPPPAQAQAGAQAQAAATSPAGWAPGAGEGEGEGEGEGAGSLEEAEQAAAGAPEWRELWWGALDALQREPVLNDTQEDVVAQLGSVAFLHCPVRHLGERGISWVRRRDWHIISSGLFMYTNDERFQVLHGEGSDDWVLQIKYVQKRDNGTYECQLATRAGSRSRRVRLRVAVPEAFILGADEHYVDAGSAINLVCIIEKSPVPPQYVFWYHNARMINYDAAAGVSVATQPGARTQSALHISAASPRHSGNYSCRAANAEPAHIYVYVSEGSDKMAATLSRNGSGAGATARGALGAALALALLAHTHAPPACAR